MAQDSSGRKVVLCVDDEPSILRSLERTLVPAGFEVLTAIGAEAGLTVLSERSGQVDALVVDQRMPGMPGEVFLEKVQGSYGAIPALMLSGYADPLALVRSINKGTVRRFLAKPWDNAELLEVVQSLAGAPVPGTSEEKTT